MSDMFLGGPDSAVVLVAEDDDAVATLIEFKLKRAGIAVERVARGDIALERLAARARAGRPFGFAVLDGRLPGKDGIAVMEEASAFGWVAGGLLASADELADVSLPSGWQTLRKPFDVGVLLKLVQEGVAIGTATATLAEEDAVIETLRAEFRLSFGTKALELRGLLAESDPPRRAGLLVSFAHNLAGAAGTYGFRELSLLAASLEESLPGEDRDAAVRRLLERLSTGG